MSWRTSLLKFVGFYGRESTLIRTGSSMYNTARHQALSPVFVRDCGLPDIFRTRFSLTSLHVWLCMVRLRSEGSKGREVSHQLHEHFANHLEEWIVEEGVHAIMIAKYVRELNDMFYGLAVSFDESLVSGDTVLASAIWHNIYGMECNDARNLTKLVGYVRQQIHELDRQPSEDVLLGNIRFSQFKPSP